MNNGKNLGLPENSENLNENTLPPVELAHQIEAFAQGARNLERMLQKERDYSRQLRDYSTKLGQQIQAMKSTEENLRGELHMLSQRDAQYSNELKRVNEAYTKIQAELTRYQRAWQAVLQREKEARVIIEDSEKEREKINQLESELRTVHEKFLSEGERREKAEALAENLRGEMQNILVRLQGSEARFSEYDKEIRSLGEIRKSHEESIRNLEQSLRDRYNEKIQEELARQAQILNYKNDQETAQKVEHARAMERELTKKETEIRMRDESERAYSSEIRRLQDEFTRALDEEKRVRRELEGKTQSQNAANIADLTEALRMSETKIQKLQKELEAQHQEKLSSIQSSQVQLGELIDQLHKTRSEIENARNEAQQAKFAIIAEVEEERRRNALALAQRDSRIGALKSECETLQKICMTEKTRYKMLISQLEAELRSADSDFTIDTEALEKLQSETEVALVSSQVRSKNN